MPFEIAKCPGCGTRLVYPDVPIRTTRGGRVIVGVKCQKCPAKVAIFQDDGSVCAYTPHQPTKVKVGKRK